MKKPTLWTATREQLLERLAELEEARVTGAPILINTEEDDGEEEDERIPLATATLRQVTRWLRQSYIQEQITAP